jgi:hypothetical protein
MGVVAVPVGRGLFKAGDFYRFGRLVDRLEELGAYYVSWSPKRQSLFAWFRESDVKKVSAWLDSEGIKYSVKPGVHNNFFIFEIRW